MGILCDVRQARSGDSPEQAHPARTVHEVVSHLVQLGQVPGVFRQCLVGGVDNVACAWLNPNWSAEHAGGRDPQT